jgi:hypothetical protein
MNIIDNRIKISDYSRFDNKIPFYFFSNSHNFDNKTLKIYNKEYKSVTFCLYSLLLQKLNNNKFTEHELLENCKTIHEIQNIKEIEKFLKDIHSENLKKEEETIFFENFNKVIFHDQLLEFYLVSTGDKKFYFEKKEDEDKIKNICKYNDFIALLETFRQKKIEEKLENNYINHLLAFKIIKKQLEIPEQVDDFLIQILSYCKEFQERQKNYNQQYQFNSFIDKMIELNKNEKLVEIDKKSYEKELNENKKLLIYSNKLPQILIYQAIIDKIEIIKENIKDELTERLWMLFLEKFNEKNNFTKIQTEIQLNLSLNANLYNFFKKSLFSLYLLNKLNNTEILGVNINEIFEKDERIKKMKNTYINDYKNQVLSVYKDLDSYIESKTVHGENILNDFEQTLLNDLTSFQKINLSDNVLFEKLIPIEKEEEKDLHKINLYNLIQPISIDYTLDIQNLITKEEIEMVLREKFQQNQELLNLWKIIKTEILFLQNDQKDDFVIYESKIEFELWKETTKNFLQNLSIQNDQLTLNNFSISTNASLDEKCLFLQKLLQENLFFQEFKKRYEINLISFFSTKETIIKHLKQRLKLIYPNFNFDIKFDLNDVLIAFFLPVFNKLLNHNNTEQNITEKLITFIIQNNLIFSNFTIDEDKKDKFIMISIIRMYISNCIDEIDKFKKIFKFQNENKSKLLNLQQTNIFNSLIDNYEISNKTNVKNILDIVKYALSNYENIKKSKRYFSLMYFFYDDKEIQILRQKKKEKIQQKEVAERKQKEEQERKEEEERKQKEEQKRKLKEDEERRKKKLINISSLTFMKLIPDKNIFIFQDENLQIYVFKVFPTINEDLIKEVDDILYFQGYIYEEKIYNKVIKFITSNNLSPNFVEYKESFSHEDVMSLLKSNQSALDTLNKWIKNKTKVKNTFNFNNIKFQAFVTKNIPDFSLDIQKIIKHKSSSPNLPTLFNLIYYIILENKITDKLKIFHELILQILFTLHLMEQFEFNHHDLHFSNILIEIARPGETFKFCYYLNKKYYTFTSQFKILIYDYDHSYCNLINERNKYIEDTLNLCTKYLRCNNFYKNKDIFFIICNFYHIIADKDFNKFMDLHFPNFIKDNNDGVELYKMLQNNLIKEQLCQFRVFKKKTSAVEKIQGLDQTFVSKFNSCEDVFKTIFDKYGTTSPTDTKPSDCLIVYGENIEQKILEFKQINK